jgi:hypothetical protein
VGATLPKAALLLPRLLCFFSLALAACSKKPPGEPDRARTAGAPRGKLVEGAGGPAASGEAPRRSPSLCARPRRLARWPPCLRGSRASPAHGHRSLRSGRRRSTASPLPQVGLDEDAAGGVPLSGAGGPSGRKIRPLPHRARGGPTPGGSPCWTARRRPFWAAKFSVAAAGKAAQPRPCRRRSPARPVGLCLTPGRGRASARPCARAKRYVRRLWTNDAGAEGSEMRIAVVGRGNVCGGLANL